jgi:ABC-type lipoprotein export system ATPase subunit
MSRVSAHENAALKLLVGGMGPRKAKQRVLPWLARLGLSDRLERTPEQLSGGERQRVAIARALAGEPKLILADEPTGNLDSARSVQTIQLLGDLAREHGAAVVLVTHDSEAAQLSDRRYTLRDGRLLDGVQPGEQRASPLPAAVPRAATGAGGG